MDDKWQVKAMQASRNGHASSTRTMRDAQGCVEFKAHELLPRLSCMASCSGYRKVVGAAHEFMRAMPRESAENRVVQHCHWWRRVWGGRSFECAIFLEGEESELVILFGSRVMDVPLPPCCAPRNFQFFFVPECLL